MPDTSELLWHILNNFHITAYVLLMGALHPSGVLLTFTQHRLKYLNTHQTP